MHFLALLIFFFQILSVSIPITERQEMAPSYLGDYFANECSSYSSNVFVTHASSYYFVPSMTLFVAIMVVSVHMWLRRCAKFVSLYFEGNMFKNMPYAELVVKRAIVFAAKQPAHLQAALLVTANEAGLKIDMPKISSFGLIARAFSNQDFESIQKRSVAERPFQAEGDDIELGSLYPPVSESTVAGEVEQGQGSSPTVVQG